MNAEKEFEALYKVYLDARRKMDINLIGSLYAKDAILIPAGSLAVEGREAICATYTDPPPEDLAITLNRVKIDNNTAWVYAIGHWSVDGHRHGLAFVDVWCRNNDKWQLSACITNSSHGFELD
jgi:ketosteroid isomerase-like protein